MRQSASHPRTRWEPKSAFSPTAREAAWEAGPQPTRVSSLRKRLKQRAMLVEYLLDEILERFVVRLSARHHDLMRFRRNECIGANLEPLLGKTLVGRLNPRLCPTRRMVVVHEEIMPQCSRSRTCAGTPAAAAKSSMHTRS
jgi:hypothetical protein